MNNIDIEYDKATRDIIRQYKEETEHNREQFLAELSSQYDWPAPLEEDAFHGLAGEFVRLVEPHSEADPAALLVQFLAAFGSAAGRNAYVRVEADSHYANLFALLVGNSAKARKGTSWAHVRRVMQLADPAWAESCIASGLASGEGLIACVNDQTEGDSSHIADKRLLAYEPEFARILQVAARDGSTLSAIIRQAWDGGSLAVLTRKDPLRARDAHISVIAHVTADELQRLLDDVIIANGFVNRFIFVAARRSKLLPFGGEVDQSELRALAEKIAAALAFARKPRQIMFDGDAARAWRNAYGSLTQDAPGLLGAATARGEAHALRLALTYAVADQSSTIRGEHLAAALAVWRYALASSRAVLGERFGNPVADRILAAVRAAGDAGISRTALCSEIFANHVSRAAIGAAIKKLAALNLVRVDRRSTGGRPEEILFPICVKSVKSVESGS